MPSGDWTEEQAARRIRPAADWQPAGDYEDIRYETADGIAKITIDRPEVRNAFRPQTLIELSDALERAREDTDVGVIVLTGEGPLAFCSGGDQRVRGDSGYLADDESGGAARPLPRDRPARADAPPAQADRGDGGRLRDRRRPRAARRLRPHDRRRQRALRPDRAEGRQLRRRLRRRPAGRARWARRRPRRSGSSAASTTRGRRSTMGLVNTVVPLEELEEETVRWCREMLELSPFALRLLKASFNAAEDGLAGHPAARPRRQPPLLRERGGAGGPRRLPREAQARLRQVPASGLEPRSRLWLAGRRGRARCRRRWRRCWWAPRSRSPRTCSGRSPSPRRWSAASSSRSAPTWRTTTRTRAAAPTPRTGSARCGSRPAG